MGIQDVFNLSWKLSHVIGGHSDASLLDTYESERIEIDRKILSKVETASNVAWNRSPIVSSLRSTAQHLLSKMVSILPLAAVIQTVQMTTYSYSDCSILSYEHWERPPLWPFPVSRIYPFGGHRRRQNLFRWIFRRVRAGDRLPNIQLSRNPKENVYPYQGDWMLILCEGQASHNDDMKRNLKNIQILSFHELFKVGESIQRKIKVIGKVVVIPGSNANAHDKLGVHGQCLFVVRPDSHVGLRSEPVRQEVVLHYFQSRVNLLLEKADIVPAPLSSRSFDPVPVVAWLTIGILSGLSLTLYNKKK